MMKILGIVATALFVLSFLLLLLSSNLRFEVGSMRLYEYGFDRYHATENTGLEKDELNKVARGLIGYFNGSRESPQVQVAQDSDQFDLFNQHELDHLKDVKGLIRLFYTVQWITLGYIVLYVVAGFVMQKGAFLRRLTQALFLGGLATLGLLIFFGIWAAIDFNGLFQAFHYVSFSNNLFQLDPTQDYLVLIFPEEFFRDATLFLGSLTLGEALITSGGAWIYKKRSYEHSESKVLPNSST